MAAVGALSQHSVLHSPPVHSLSLFTKPQSSPPFPPPSINTPFPPLHSSHSEPTSSVDSLPEFGSPARSMRREMAMMALAVVLAMAGSAAVDAKQAVDCSTLVLGMADCLTYVTNGSTVEKPEGQCCAGLKTVLRTDAQCLCDAFKNSASFGVSLNLTKALALPTACDVSAPSAKNCGVSLSPSGAPVASPAGAPASSIANAPAAVGASETSPTPTPAPGKNASPELGMSMGSPIFCLVAAIFWSY